MDPVPLARAGLFLPFFGFLERSGLSVERRLGDVLLPTYALSDPNALIPLNQGLRFLDRIAGAEGLDDLGLRVGAETQLEGLGLFWELARRAPNLSKAIDRLNRGAAHYCATLKVWLAPWEQKSRLCFEFSEPRSGTQHLHQFTLMLFAATIRLFAGPKWRPAEIHADDGLSTTLASRCPALLEAPIVRRPVTALVLEPSLLGIPRLANDLSESSADRKLQELAATAPATDFPASLEQTIRMFLTDERFGIHLIAEVVEVSPRTLQRRLTETGAEFSDLVDRVRFDAAVDLIGRGVKLADVAYELGYADSANFTRAFRRWSGSAPSRFPLDRIERQGWLA